MGLKRLITIVISIAILAAIYSLIDLGNFKEVVLGCDVWLLIGGLALVVPITVVTAWRFLMLVPARAGIGLGEALKLVLAASTLNLVLPSKMGDLSKAWFMRNKGHMPGPAALSVVMFEKLCDVLSLLTWCLVGLLVVGTEDMIIKGLGAAAGCFWLIGVLLLLSRRMAALAFGLARLIPWDKLKGFVAKTEAAWSEMQAQISRTPAASFKVGLTSLGLWLMHVFQIWVFILALGGDVPVLVSFSLSALAIFAGLLPLSFAGIGTRDAAIIYFYAGYFGAATGAALGILCTMRYIMPALAGWPFFGGYMQKAPELEITTRAD